MILPKLTSSLHGVFCSEGFGNKLYIVDTNIIDANLSSHTITHKKIRDIIIASYSEEKSGIKELSEKSLTFQTVSSHTND